MGFCLFIWLVGCFLTSKQNTHGESFVFWSNSAPSPADFRSTQAEKSAEGHSWLIRMPVVAHVDFRPLVALNLCVCVLCPSPSPFCQGTGDSYLGKTFLKMYHVCVCILRLLYGQMLSSRARAFAHHSIHASSPRSASPQVFLGRALRRKLLSSIRHCV